MQGIKSFQKQIHSLQKCIEVSVQQQRISWGVFFLMSIKVTGLLKIPLVCEEQQKSDKQERPSTEESEESERRRV